MRSKYIDIDDAIDMVAHAHDYLDDRIQNALDDDNIGGYNLLKVRQDHYYKLLARLEHKRDANKLKVLSNETTLTNKELDERFSNIVIPTLINIRSI